jgi:hypothetical protein
LGSGWEAIRGASVVGIRAEGELRTRRGNGGILTTDKASNAVVGKEGTMPLTNLDPDAADGGDRRVTAFPPGGRRESATGSSDSSGYWD